MSFHGQGSILFTLPRELRDKIYHHLLSGLAYDIPTDSQVLTIEYGFIPPDRSFHRMCSQMSLEKAVYVRYPAPQWLLTCSQILSEGLAQFSRGAKCTDVMHYTRYPGEPEWKTKLVQDTLLLPRVHEIYLAVAPVTHSEPYPQPSKIACRFQTQDPELAKDADLALGYRNILPQIRRISVEAQIRTLTIADGADFCLPAYERLFKQIYFFPGSMYEEAHLHIQMPCLPGSSYGGGLERVRNLPPMARTLPRLQASLVELGKSLTANALKQSQTTDGKSWVVRDWIDHSTRAWHVTIRRRSMGPPTPNILEYCGLQYFIAPDLRRAPSIVGRYAEELVFERDRIPINGHSSWSCNDTGETVWLEDGPVGSQSGYMNSDVSLTESRYEAVFEELRRKQHKIAAVSEGMGKVELPPRRPPRSTHFRGCY